MTTPKRLLLSVGVTLVILAPLLLGPPRNAGPSYAGKSLNKWVILVGRGYWEDPPSPELRSTAEQAITNIGTNAIPFLLHWICYEPTGSRIGRRIAFIMTKLPGPARFQFLADPHRRPTDEILARGARTAFRILGPTASPAISGLSNLVVSSQSAQVKDRAAEALASIGTAALSTMISLLTNCTDRVSRLYLLYAIISFGTNAEPAIPAILACGANPSGDLNSSIESAFEQLSSQSRAFADALETLRKAQARPVQVQTISYEFGDDPPVPFLLACLKSPEPAIRLAATNALRKIAPHVLTNAPAR